MKKYLYLLAFISLSGSAWAAPCCGGASALPALISGDDSAQLSASVSHAQVIGDAPPSGLPVFRSSKDQELSQSLRLDGAYRFQDSWQAGVGVPLVRKSHSISIKQESEAGLGDVSMDLAYEFLPELGYSEWKPKGFVFADLTLPTGPSIYDSATTLSVDARGRGFVSPGLGLVLLKSWGRWNVGMSTELHRSLNRGFTLSDGSRIESRPGWGGSAQLSGGVSLGGGDWNLGLSLTPIFEGAIETSGDLSSRSDSQLVWNTSVQLTRSLTPEWSASATYLDQTLMGPAHNVALSRSVALLLQKRWPL